MELTLARVDHRLVHGQVTVGWARAVRAELLLVVSDRVAGDPFETSLMQMAVPHGIRLEVWTRDQAVSRIRAGDLPAGRAMLLVATPLDLVPLLDAGLALDEVNIGGVRSPGAHIKLTKEVHATEEELAAWQDLAARGLRLSVQWLPDQRRRLLNQELPRP